MANNVKPQELREDLLISHRQYKGLSCLLAGDAQAAQAIWMDLLLESTIEEAEKITKQLVKILEDTAIKLLQAGNNFGAKKCYQAAMEIDEDFQNSTLEKILLWRENYTQDCENKGYKFTTDWFSGNILVWNQVLTRFTNSPDARFLEVGSWEGRTACWLLDNILRNETSTLTCIDTFQGSIEHESMGFGEHLNSLESIFEHNIKQTGRSEQVKKLVGYSQEWLRQLPVDTFNFLYIDGSHVAADVLEDAILGWRLVKIGGIIIFDDYEWGAYQDQPTLHPKLAVDSFLNIFQNKLKIIYKGYQVVVEKIAN